VAEEEARAAGANADVEAFELSDHDGIVAAMPKVLARHGRLHFCQ
jgi:hypothetical protein